MASYTIEDIELIRSKSGISYQEAVALLDYHNGNVARALVDLERNGRIKADATPKAQPAADHKPGRKSGFSEFISKLYRFRLKIRKDNVTVANISLLYTLLAALIAGHLVIVSAILVLILGYKVSFNRDDQDFTAANLERMVRSAADTVKNTVSDLAKNFETTNAAPAAHKAPIEEDAPKAEERSYYNANPAATTYHTNYGASAPTLQVPVQVESQDGNVSIDADSDGYTNATIE